MYHIYESDRIYNQPTASQCPACNWSFLDGSCRQITKRCVSFFCKSKPLDTSDPEPSNLCNIVLDTLGRNHWMRLGLTIGVSFFQRLVLFQQIGPSEVGQFHRVSRCLSWNKKPTLKLAIVSTYTVAVGESRKELQHQSKLKIGPIISTFACNQMMIKLVGELTDHYIDIPRFRSSSRCQGTSRMFSGLMSLWMTCREQFLWSQRKLYG